jgi:transcriptional regulator with XRE-family HTH domain
MTAFGSKGKIKREAALAETRAEKQLKRSIRRKMFQKPPPCPSEAEQDEIIRSLSKCSAEDLIQRLKDQEYRYLVNSVFNYWRLRTQIKALREQRGWTQAELARRAHMWQSEIARLENIYMPYDVRTSTLLRLAHAFDVCLIIRFEDWGSFIKEIFSVLGNPAEVLRFDSFGDDSMFHVEHA